MSSDMDKNKKLLEVVCICKGINLRRILKGLMQCNSIAEVNAATGAGSGGCKGQRCGPRIRILLDKKTKMSAPTEAPIRVSPEP